MTAEFKTTDELVADLNSCLDSLRRLQDAEPNWRRPDRERGLRNIQALRERIATTEAELKMATGR